MSISAAAKNDALDGLTINRVSVHDAFPGATGANEISGSVRANVTIAAAVGGQRSLSSAASVTLPAATVRWLGWWNSSEFLFATPNGGFTPKNFVAAPSTDLIYSTAHPYADTDKVVFWGGTAPAPLVTGTVYFVRDATADSFKVAATSGGTAIDITGAPSAGCWVSAIEEKTYSQAASHMVTTATFMIAE